MLAYAIAGALASAMLATAQNTTSPSPPPDSGDYHPHGAFAFIRTGERTPLSRPGSPLLSAVGANTMLTLGQNFRTRYISGASPAGLGSEPIAGLAPSILNNEQVNVQTGDAQYLVAAAQAFMQGLYPPHATGKETGLLADGSTVEYPLQGYQYAAIHTHGVEDAESIFVSGSRNCPIAQRDAMRYFTTDEFMKTKGENRELYEKLDLAWFEGNLGKDDVDYISALEIADYLRYQHQHNSSIYTALSNDSNYANVYSEVLRLADEEAWYLYGNTSSSNQDADNQAMAGKTLAAAVLQQFQLLVANGSHEGNPDNLSHPLTFFFGEQEPMMSLLSLMLADLHNDYFRTIPTWGSAIVFELYSTGPNAQLPTNEHDLWVRFYYHNATAGFPNHITTHPILGNGPSGTEIPWPDFQAKFSQLSVQRPQWCASCSSSALFCTAGSNSTRANGTAPTLLASRHHTTISPAVAATIAALTTLVVAALVTALAMLLLGIRFHRVARSTITTKATTPYLGGFKGSAKLASDPDLSLARGAVPPAAAAAAGIVTGAFAGGDVGKGHERLGSWELRQKEFGEGKWGDCGDGRDSFDDGVGARVVVPEERV